MSRGAKLALEIRQGADFWLLFQLFDEPPGETVTPEGMVVTPGVPTDLTGLTFRAQFRAPDTKGAVEIEALPSDFQEVTRDVNGVAQPFVQLHFPHGRTALMTAANGVYDIEMVDPAADTVTEVMYGPYTLALEVTRSE